MRVLQVIPAMSASAGAETSLFEVAPFLLRAGLDLHLAVLSPHQDLVPALAEQGVVIHDLSGRSGVRQSYALGRTVRAIRPDLLHASLLQAALPTQVIGRLIGVPVLVTWASTPTGQSSGEVAQWKLDLVRFAEMGAAALSRSRFHAVTQGVARAKCAELHVRPERVRVAERGRDPDRYRSGTPEKRVANRAEFGVADGEFVFLAVGRQEPQKGYVDLLRAFDEVASDTPRCRLLIAGRPGSVSNELEHVRSGLRHADRVSILGHRDDIAELMAAADAVVCASHREGAAGALIEAMAAGTPIVSVELDGMSGILVDGVNSIVVQRADLAEGMRRIMSDPAIAHQLALAAGRLFDERFTTVRSAQSLLEVYRWAVS